MPSGPPWVLKVVWGKNLFHLLQAAPMHLSNVLSMANEMLMATMFLPSQSEYDQSIKEKQLYMG